MRVQCNGKHTSAQHALSHVLLLLFGHLWTMGGSSSLFSDHFRSLFASFPQSALKSFPLAKCKPSARGLSAISAPKLCGLGEGDTCCSTIVPQGEFIRVWPERKRKREQEKREGKVKPHWSSASSMAWRPARSSAKGAVSLT